MSRIIDSRPIVLRSVLFLALPVILSASTALADPIAGSGRSPGTGRAVLRGGPGGAAALRKGYFSPALGAWFEIQQIQVPGGRFVTGARLAENPVAGSPLSKKGLLPGDIITHLDGLSVIRNVELEQHVNATTVSWIADQTQATRTFEIFIPSGKPLTPNGPNVGIVGTPVLLGDIAGRWNCSCGAVWTLAQQGRTINGNETDAQSNNRVSGTLNNRSFDFTYFHQQGYSGTGSFTADPTFTSMTGTIRWQDGTTSTPRLTRARNNPGTGNSTPVPNPNPVTVTYTAIGLRNRSNQVINCEFRWGGGAWEALQLKPGLSWTLWSNGQGQRAQLKYGTQITNLSGASVTLKWQPNTPKPQPTFNDASVYSLQVFGGQLVLAQ